LIKFRAEVGGPLLHGSNASHRKRKKDSGKIETIKPTYKNTSKKCLFFLSLSLFLFSHTAWLVRFLKIPPLLLLLF
jgi:hypothetical protein